jgi:dihydrofolate reductase
MGKVILSMAMSLDGFINDRTGSSELLYENMQRLRDSEVIQESIRTTGAVVMGERTFEMSEDPDWYAGNYEYQVPLFVLTHTPPVKKPREAGGLTFTFVTDGAESAVAQAKAAAGDKDVVIVGGAGVAQQCLKAGLVDELRIDIAPILLHAGQRLFDNFDMEPTRLERLPAQDTPGRIGLRFRILK